MARPRFGGMHLTTAPPLDDSLPRDVKTDASEPDQACRLRPFAGAPKTTRYRAGRSPAPVPSNRRTSGFSLGRIENLEPGRLRRPGRNDRGQALSAPEALPIWVAMKSISPGDRQS